MMIGVIIHTYSIMEAGHNQAHAFTVSDSPSFHIMREAQKTKENSDSGNTEIKVNLTYN